MQSLKNPELFHLKIKTSLIKKLEKSYGNYFREKENKANFAETNFRGLLTYPRKLISLRYKEELEKTENNRKDSRKLSENEAGMEKT